MSPKIKNLIVRAITGIIYVAIMVVSFMRPLATAFLFTLITGMAVWEFSGLVNERPGVNINRFISQLQEYFCHWQWRDSVPD